jgi:hypothetical protein
MITLDCSHLDESRTYCRRKRHPLENGYAVEFHCGGCKYYTKAKPEVQEGRRADYKRISVTMILLIVIASLIAAIAIMGISAPTNLNGLCMEYCNSSFVGYYQPYFAAFIPLCEDDKVILKGKKPASATGIVYCCRDKSRWNEPCGI